MSVFKNIVCPISSERADSNLSRLTVFFNAILIAIFLVTKMPIFMTIVVIDSGIRAIISPRLSPIRLIAKFIANITKLPIKMADIAPKLFAYRVGFLLALICLLLFQYNVAASLVVATNLLVLAILDSVFNFCVGCLTYHYIVFPWLGKNRG